MITDVVISLVVINCQVSDFTDCPCALLDGTPQLGEIWADIDPANAPWLLPLDLMRARGRNTLDLMCSFGMCFFGCFGDGFWRCVVFFFAPRYYNRECSGEPDNQEFRMLTDGPPNKNPLHMRFLNLSHTRFLI